MLSENKVFNVLVVVFIVVTVIIAIILFEVETLYNSDHPGSFDIPASASKCGEYRHVLPAWLSWFIIYYLWVGHSHTFNSAFSLFYVLVNKHWSLKFFLECQTGLTFVSALHCF